MKMKRKIESITEWNTQPKDIPNGTKYNVKKNSLFCKLMRLVYLLHRCETKLILISNGNLTKNQTLMPKCNLYRWVSLLLLILFRIVLCSNVQFFEVKSDMHPQNMKICIWCSVMFEYGWQRQTSKQRE